MKRILLIFFTTLLVFASTTFISGAKPENTPKEEVVYGLLDSSGALSGITVVNGFFLEKDGLISDYGTYASVQNLSSDDQISQSGSYVSFAGKSGRVNYQGELENRQLPWTVNITYYLNGQQIPPEELDGSSGKLKLVVQTTRNQLEKGAFFDDFSLQISIPMKMDRCRNISTSGATVADNGSTKQFSYIVLPGENGTISLTADVDDFEMDPITMAGIRMVFDLPLDAEQINSAIDRLVAAAGKLDGGAVSLLGGADALKKGLQQYTDGFALLNGQLGSLKSGADSLDAGLADLRDGLTSLSDQGATLRDGAEAISQSVFDNANNQLSGMGLPTLTPDNYESILGGLPGSPTIDALILQLDDITAFVSGVEAYTLGTTQMAAGASGLSDGASNLADGVETLAVGLDQLYESSISLNEGMKEFLEGVAAYRSGTKAFHAQTNQMEADLGAQLDSLIDMLSSDGKVFHSYVSDENTNVNFVQFVIKTGGISADAPPPAEEPKPVEKNLWEKFLDLFDGLFN